jgi:hypothetical protein
MGDSQGVTLDQYLNRKGGKVAADWAIRIMTPVMDALQQAHSQNVPHGPINPDTVFLSNQGQVEVLEAHGPDAQLMPGYAAPELYQSNAQQAPSAAVYAIAATLYRAITGWAPPHAASRLQGKTFLAPSDLGVSLQPHVEAALMKALAIEPVYRFPSIAEFQTALNGTVQDAAATPPPAPALSPALIPRSVDPHAETKPISAAFKAPLYDIHSVETKPITLPPLPVVNTPLETPKPPRGKQPLPLWLIAIGCGIVGLVGFFLFRNEAGPPAPVIQSFTADRTQIEQGEQVILSWSVRGDADVTIDPGGKPVPSFGQIAVAPAETTTFTLRARNTRTIVAQEVTIQVAGRRRSRSR